MTIDRRTVETSPRPPSTASDLLSDFGDAATRTGEVRLAQPGPDHRAPFDVVAAVLCLVEERSGQTTEDVVAASVGVAGRRLAQPRCHLA